MNDAFAAFTAFLIAALPLSVGVTKVIDTLRNLFDSDDSLPKALWNILALLVGVGLCVGWQFNLFEALVEAVPALKGSGIATGVMGQVITGVAIGAMAGFWHEKMDEWSAIAKANKAESVTPSR